MLYFDNCYKQLASLIYAKPVRLVDIAIQFNILGEGNGIFYVENKNSKLSVEPYNYFDNDAVVEATFETLMLVFTNQISVEEAMNKGIMTVKGNINKVLCLFAI